MNGGRRMADGSDSTSRFYNNPCEPERADQDLDVSLALKNFAFLSTNTLTASADRRPVDPPPVVKLKVTCGEVGAEQDITMNFESQLIIFTTLEVARPIANGRMYAQNHRPVLTGTCAAGTSHLEKPFPAAYFIFPDLSVRHEGWYNLRFSLFEKITNEADRGVDEHRETIQQHEDKHSPSVWDGLVNRMEVRTSKFQVYSAKKFPGLKGSTELSRLIADQGCRVRIRREVRQRKRPTKEGAEEDEDRVSAEQTPTPSDAARSISRNSQTGSTYFQNFPDRRYSNESSYAQQNALAPMRPPQSPAERSNSWGTWTPAPSSIVSTFNMPPPAAKLQRPSYSSYESNSSNNTTISLPPLSHLDVRNTINNTIGTNPAGLYNIPEIAPAQKRGYSPHSSTYIDQSAPIKDGARPDMVPLQQPMPFKPAEPKFGGGQGLGQGIMEADSDEETSDSDDLLSGDYTYKRADGRRGNKVVPHLMHYKSR